MWLTVTNKIFEFPPYLDSFDPVAYIKKRAYATILLRFWGMLYTWYILLMFIQVNYT